MSWEEQFYLPEPIACYSADDIAGRIRRMVPPRATASATVDGGVITVKVRFEISLVDEVAAMLGSSPQNWLGYDWRAELDPPRDPMQSYYEIVIELVEMDHHELRVASSDADNRAAWPLAFALAGRLAEEYEATDDPPRSSPGVDELN